MYSVVDKKSFDQAIMLLDIIETKKKQSLANIPCYLVGNQFNCEESNGITRQVSTVEMQQVAMQRRINCIELNIDDRKESERNRTGLALALCSSVFEALAFMTMQSRMKLYKQAANSSSSCSVM